MKAELSGVVKQFRGNGRKLGYPTANLSIETDLEDGVYYGYADLTSYRYHPSLIFVGTPTTMHDMIRRVEVHLLDIPDVDYYGQELSATLMHYHRPNQTFQTIEELKKIMKQDELSAREWFKNRTIA